MRRVHLRGHTNILKRLLIHAGGFNLGLLMRRLIGVGTLRGFAFGGARRAGGFWTSRKNLETERRECWKSAEMALP